MDSLGFVVLLGVQRTREGQTLAGDSRQTAPTESRFEYAQRGLGTIDAQIRIHNVRHQR